MGYEIAVEKWCMKSYNKPLINILSQCNIRLDLICFLIPRLPKIFGGGVNPPTPPRPRLAGFESRT